MALGSDKYYYDHRLVQRNASLFLTEYTFYDKEVTYAPMVWSLKRITYPTGGYTEYEYESNKYQNGTDVINGYGIRIKKISSNTGDGATLTREYKYGENEVGWGVSNLHIGPGDFVSEGLCSINQPMDAMPQSPRGFAVGPQISYSNQPNNEAVSDGDAKLFYPEVNEYIEGGQGTILGKTQYLYDAPDSWYEKYSVINTNSLYPHTSIGIEGDMIRSRAYFPRVISKVVPWAKPFLTEINTSGFSNGSFNLLKKEHFDNTEIIRDTFTGLKVRPFLAGGDHEYGEGAPSPDQSEYQFLGLESVFDFATYNVISGVVLPTKKTTTEYSTAGNLVTEQDFYYNENDQLTKEEVSNSRTGDIVTEYKYPVDYKNLTGTDAVTQGIKKLQDLNVVEPVIEKSVWRKNSSGIKSLMHSQLTTFSNISPVPQKVLQIENNALLSDFVPSYVQSGAVVSDSRYKEKVLFDVFDSKGNILQQHKADDAKQSYIWGYNQSLPIAHVDNAASNEIFFDSFEEGEGWDGITAPVYSDRSVTYDDNKSRAGRYSGKIVRMESTEQYSHSNKTLNISLSTPTKFLYSGWYYSDGPSVDIYLFMKRANEAEYYSYVDHVTSAVTGKWVYLEKEYVVPADVTQLNIRLDNNGGGTVWFDDIRLHPADARMTSYTYDPLIGMTSATDINNNTTFYEYDNFGRLSIIRDKDKNVLKSYCYGYAGDIGPCTLPVTFYNTDQSDYYTRNDCSVGETSAPKYVSVPANLYRSTISQEDANNKAREYGQDYANQMGSCDPIPITYTFSNTSTTSDNFIVEFTNVNTSDFYQFTMWSGTGQLGTLPAGIYNITIYNVSDPGEYSYEVNCSYSYFGQVCTLYDVTVDTYCSYIEIY